MKRFMYLSLAAVALFLHFSGFSQSNELVIPLTNAGQIGHLNVDIHAGTVNIVGTDRDDVLLKYELLEKEEEGSPTSKAANGMTRISSGGIKLDIVEKDNVVHIDSGHGNKAVALWVEVPKDFNLNVETHHYGEVAIEKVNGEIVIDAHHGGIKAHDISGSIVANTWHGDILVEMTGMNREAAHALTTYHGTVDVSLPTSA
ncbi:MAG: hypothetical protein AAF399_06965, partial [Bacteroidota bacterium]